MHALALGLRKHFSLQAIHKPESIDHIVDWTS